MVNRATLGHDCGMDQLKQAAEARIRYLLWLADKLEASDDAEYRRAAAEALRQVAGQ